MTDTTSSRGSGDGGSLADEAIALSSDVAQFSLRVLLQARDIAAGRIAGEPGGPATHVAERALHLAGRALAAPPTLARAIATAAGHPAPAGIVAAKTLALVAIRPEPQSIMAGMMLDLLADLAVLPPEVVAQAEIFGGEMALPPEAALQAFDALAARGYAVFGVERWVRAGKAVEWMGTSDYEATRCRSLADWAEYVSCCLASAKAFVEWGSAVRGALFNYTWGDKEFRSAVNAESTKAK